MQMPSHERQSLDRAPTEENHADAHASAGTSTGASCNSYRASPFLHCATSLTDAYVTGPPLGLVVPLLLCVGGEFGVSENLRHICAAVLPTRADLFRYFDGLAPAQVFSWRSLAHRRWQTGLCRCLRQWHRRHMDLRRPTRQTAALNSGTLTITLLCRGIWRSIMRQTDRNNTRTRG